GRLAERTVADRGHGNEPDAEAARVVDQMLELDRLSRPGQRHDHVIGRDHAEVAMARFAWMDEEGGRAGGREGGGDFSGDMAGLAHAGHDQPAVRVGDQVYGGYEGAAEPIVDGGCERGEPGGFDVERSHRRGDQLAAAGAHTSFSAQRLRHRDPTVCKGARSAPPAEILYPLSLG